MLELLIDKDENKKQIALLENGNLVEYYIDDEKNIRKEGNIYVGVIKDVIKGMQAAFVDIGTEKNSFIHLKDLLPKVDETKEKIDENMQTSIYKVFAGGDIVGQKATVAWASRSGRDAAEKILKYAVIA